MYKKYNLHKFPLSSKYRPNSLEQPFLLLFEGLQHLIGDKSTSGFLTQSSQQGGDVVTESLLRDMEELYFINTENMMRVSHHNLYDHVLDDFHLGSFIPIIYF